jgi:N4-gp56 family major capsid protein
MATTKLTELTDTIPTIIEEAQYTSQFKAVMRGLAWNVKKGKGTTVNIPYFNEAVSHKLNEGVDMTTSETMQDTNVQITPYEAGLKIILTDNVIEDNNEDLIRAAGRLLGDGFEKKRDEDLLARLDNATVSMGASGSTMTMGYIAAARAQLQGNATSTGGPAPSPFVAVIHPFQELDIVDVVTPWVVAATSVAGFQAQPGSLSADVLANYSIGKLFGIPIVCDGNLSIDSADDTKGGVFAMGFGGGIVYVSAREPSIEEERDASLRGWELNYVGRYGVGNYLNGWTVELYTDASTPA